ncbi:MAG: pyridoxal-phosphate dependent enzyme [Candidatus Thermoplasmatota archaeon]|nr:pyridoxal-phosphate dependent enzyme [Candidatus Thermoplasmatota archaeon]MCL5988368.1 pyridoxal-phosphate dependent enzyme [Candidatus Thermoplasmatota archaeon]
MKKLIEQVLDEEKPPGMTPLFRAVNTEFALKLKNVFFKYEGVGPTGTQKDRISRLHVTLAKSRGYDTISVATCGNYGASVSYYASMSRMKSVVAIPSFYAGTRNAEIYENGSDIIVKNMKYEDLVDYMKGKSEAENWYNCSPSSDNSWVDIVGYRQIAYEIVQQLGHAPGYVAIPAGNGTTLAGVYSGFRKLYLAGETDSMPRFIGSSTSLGNPIVFSWKHGYRQIQILDSARIIETGINEPLVSFKAFDGQRALNAIYQSKGAAIAVDDQEMSKYARIIENTQGIKVLPASASALAAAHKYLRNRIYGKELVVVLTGRGHT